MSETTGQQLVAEREKRGLSIEDVAHQTRIHHDVVRQLEADDYTKFPNLMFVRSFLDLYSRFLDIDASAAIAQLRSSATNHHGEQYLLGCISPTLREKYGHLTRRIPMRPIIASAAAIALLAVGGPHLVSHLYGAGSSTESPAVQSPQPGPEKTANPPEGSAEPDKNAIDLVRQPGGSPPPATSRLLPATTDEVAVEKIEINMNEIPKATVARPSVKRSEPYEVFSPSIETDLDGQTSASGPGEDSNLGEDAREIQDVGGAVEEEFLDPGTVTEE